MLMTLKYKSFSEKELHSLLDELFNDEGNEEEEAVIQPPGPLMK